jgi:hypothetical protein
MPSDLEERLAQIAEHTAAAQASLTAIRERVAAVQAMVVAIRTDIVPGQPDDTIGARYAQGRR